MDEAQELADRVAIINRGEIVAQGRPDELGGRDLRCEIRFRLPQGVGAAELPVEARVEDGRATVLTELPLRPLNALTGWALERGYDLPDLEVERPSLEDVYLELTEDS
jgi:ABC-2 type transport system ATP-binding protein